jgi:hypothetical protein
MYHPSKQENNVARLVNIKQWKADSRTQDTISTMVKKAEEHKWKNFVDGLPVVHDLGEFMLELKKVMPNVWFIPTDHDYVQEDIKDENGVYQTSINIRVVNEVAVCLDDFPFDMGRINYQDNTVGKSKDYTYGVYSRKIKNDKYGTHREQYNMIMGRDLKKAVKNAQKYLMPYSVKELAQAFYDPIRSNIQSEFSKVQGRATDLASIVRNNHHAILQEIHALKQAGVLFKTEEFRQVADKVDEVLGELETESSRKVGATFVRFYKVGDESYVTLQEATNIRTSWDKAKVDETTVGYKASELPQDVMGAVSVLSILNDGQYVANVGMRVDDNHFWIERG